MNKIAVIVPFWKRTELTKICFEYLEAQSKRIGFDVFVSGDDKSIVPNSFNWVDTENYPLGKKHNDLLKATKDYDGSMIIGSDNFVSDSIFELYQSMDLSEAKFYGFDNAFVYSAYTKKLGSNFPYTEDLKHTIGVARLWTGSALSEMNYSIWDNDKNRGLDGSSKRNLNAKGIQETKLNADGHFIFGVKYGESITHPSLVENAGKYHDSKLINEFLGDKVAEDIFNLKPLEQEQLLKTRDMSREGKLKTEILVDFQQFKKGQIKYFRPLIARSLSRIDKVKLLEEYPTEQKKETPNYSEMKLSELRKLFPEIKATSVKQFVEKINA